MRKKQAVNPYLPLDTYIPDGEPHVFGNRVYIVSLYEFYLHLTMPQRSLPGCQRRGIPWSVSCSKSKAEFTDEIKELVRKDVK